MELLILVWRRYVGLVVLCVGRLEGGHLAVSAWCRLASTYESYIDKYCLRAGMYGLQKSATAKSIYPMLKNISAPSLVHNEGVTSDKVELLMLTISICITILQPG